MELKRVGTECAQQLWKMQKKSFAELLNRYQDYDTSPANESVDKIYARLQQPFTYYYCITDGDNTVGAIRVVDKKDGSRKRISPLFVLPEYRGKGYAQRAMQEAERLHGADNWALDTILEEAGNCYLYEKLGYRKTGETQKINERMTLVFYEKTEYRLSGKRRDSADEYSDQY